jgi:hypothetical protein
MKLFLTFLLLFSLHACVNTKENVNQITYRANVNHKSKDGFLDYVYARIKRNDSKVVMNVSPFENLESALIWEFVDCKFTNSNDWFCNKDDVTVRMMNGNLILTNNVTKDSDIFKPFKD